LTFKTVAPSFTYTFLVEDFDVITGKRNADLLPAEDVHHERDPVGRGHLDDPGLQGQRVRA
jgi:hypothetical protein